MLPNVITIREMNSYLVYILDIIFHSLIKGKIPSLYFILWQSMEGKVELPTLIYFIEYGDF